MSAFTKQVGGNYYKQYKIQPYEFFYRNNITHDKAAIIRRILRYDQPGGKGLEDLQKIQHECDLLKELNGYEEKTPAQKTNNEKVLIEHLRYLSLVIIEILKLFPIAQFEYCVIKAIDRYSREKESKITLDIEYPKEIKCE